MSQDFVKPGWAKVHRVLQFSFLLSVTSNGIYNLKKAFALPVVRVLVGASWCTGCKCLPARLRRGGAAMAFLPAYILLSITVEQSRNKWKIAGLNKNYIQDGRTLDRSIRYLMAYKRERTHPHISRLSTPHVQKCRCNCC